MRNGKLYIDGQDAYAAFGVWITHRGHEGVIRFPAMKDVEINDWPEEDGIEPDLSQPVLSSKEFAISFAAHGDIRTSKFLDLISDGAYHTFGMMEVGRSCRLRLLSQASLTAKRELELFSLQFADDFPLPEGYVYVPPQSGIIPVQGIELDGTDLSNYGVRVLAGSRSEILKSPAVKRNLLVDFKQQNGAFYDDEFVVFKQKEVKLNLLMRANTLNEFWHNYDALLYDLSRPGERKLFVEDTGYEYPCYYKSCDVIEFSPDPGKIWFKFGLAFVFISFRRADEDTEYLLAAENGDLLVTESSPDDSPVYIDMGYGA
jgi:hypothetical protein